VILQDRPIEEYIGAIERRLADVPGKTARFEDLFDDARDRYEAIGFLLAILELAKERRLSFEQEDLFGPIQVRLHDEDEVRRLRAAARGEGAATDPAEKFLLQGEGLEAARDPIPEEAGLETGSGEPAGPPGDR
jgi:hypothetical protein